MENIILDVDTGIDDALAIVYAVVQKKAKINLISCSYGNTSAEQATKNTLNVLNLINRADIPVVKGEEKPLISERDSSISVHGKYGLGEYVFPPNKIGRVLDDAMEVMRDTILKTKGKTTLIALGPLTNIAKLLHIYPSVKKKIKEIIISGGLLEDNKKKPYIGFNIAMDSYAVEYIFNSNVKTTICPSDFGHQAYLTYEDQDVIASYNNTGKVFREILPFHHDRHVKTGAAVHDTCAVACCTNKRLFKFSKRYVYLRKVRAAGKSVIDFDAKLKKHHIKAKVAEKMDVEKVKELIFESFREMP